MAHPDQLLSVVPLAAARAFAEGDERRALTLLARARDGYAPQSPEWAQLERLYGLVLIHVLREVEGTFALERSDAALLSLGAELPTLDDLEARAGAASL